MILYPGDPLERNTFGTALNEHVQSAKYTVYTA